MDQISYELDSLDPVKQAAARHLEATRLPKLCAARFTVLPELWRVRINNDKLCDDSKAFSTFGSYRAVGATGN